MLGDAGNLNKVVVVFTAILVIINIIIITVFIVSILIIITIIIFNFLLTEREGRY